MPDSPLVLVAAVGLFVFAMVISTALIPSAADMAFNVFIQSVIVSVGGYLLYWVVLVVTGYPHRLIPTIASIMACGSILTIAMVAVFLILGPLTGTNAAALIAWLILMWSVPVKGHIIARAIGQHWYIGIAIASTVFIIQRVAFDILAASPGN